MTGNFPAQSYPTKSNRKSKAWRLLHGFDNIDRKPKCENPVEKYTSPAERILDAELRDA